MIFLEVTAEEEAVVFEDVGQGQRQRRGGGEGAGHDSARARARHQRADGQAKLVHQPGLQQLGELVRAYSGTSVMRRLAGSRSSRAVTTAIGGVGGRPSRR